MKFEVWDINALRDEFVAVKSIEEQYPGDVTITLADKHFLTPEGDLKNITFAVRGTTLQDLAHKYKETLFNWNIRRFLGRKGEVNSGLRGTLEKEPELFYYYNNGISALCNYFDFEEITKKLTIKKLQIVNGAQTLGALRYADTEKVRNALVVVKLTAIKHATREQGIAATLIKTNNTQNTLRIPDFRSNNKIQIWLDNKFKATKPRGELLQIAYGRKRPHPSLPSLFAKLVAASGSRVIHGPAEGEAIVDPRIATCLARLRAGAPYRELAWRRARIEPGGNAASVKLAHDDGASVTLTFAVHGQGVRGGYKLDRAIDSPPIGLVEGVRAAMLALRG